MNCGRGFIFSIFSLLSVKRGRRCAKTHFAAQKFAYVKKKQYLCSRNQIICLMTALQLNAELYRAMSEIADDETLLTKLLKYAQSLVTKKKDRTLMTKDEFFANVDEALEQAKQGRVHRMRSDESLEDFLRRVG